MEAELCKATDFDPREIQYRTTIFDELQAWRFSAFAITYSIIRGNISEMYSFLKGLGLNLSSSPKTLN